jgi:hypothetical protein
VRAISAEASPHGNDVRPLVAHCHLDLGKLYRRIGEREPVRSTS